MASPLKAALCSLILLAASAATGATSARADEDEASDLPPDAPGDGGKIVQVQQPAPAAPAAAAPEAAPAAKPSGEGSDPEIHLRKSTMARRMFGSYRVRVGLARPNFNDGLKYYKDLYGNPRGMPMVGADWFPWDWYATLGLSLKFGYYSADGYAAHSVGGKKAGDYTSGDIVQDKHGPTSLTLIPLQLAASAEFTPFSRKWIVLDGWIGYERIYWQETRTVETTASPTTTGPTTTPTKTAPAKDDALVNSGTLNETAIGVAANFLLNPLDEETALSDRGTLGIDAVYASPYLQIVRTLGKNGPSFGRTEIGLAFTFETAK